MLKLLKGHLFLYPNDVDGVSARLFRISARWSVNSGDVWHDICRSASSWRSLPASFDFFAAIFLFMPLVVYFLGTWPHVYIGWVTPILPVQSNPKVRLTYINLKLIAYRLSSSMLSVMLLLKGYIIISKKWVTVPLYLPSKLLRSLNLTCLLIPCMPVPLSSVMCTFSVPRLPLVVVSALLPPIVSMLPIFSGLPMTVTVTVTNLLTWIAPLPLLCQ